MGVEALQEVGSETVFVFFWLTVMLDEMLNYRPTYKSPVKDTAEYSAYSLRKQPKKSVTVFSSRTSNPSMFSEMTGPRTNRISSCSILECTPQEFESPKLALR